MKKNYQNIDELFADWMMGKRTDKDIKMLLYEDEFVHFKKLQKSIEIWSELERPLTPEYQKILFKIKKAPSKPKNKIFKLAMRVVIPVAAILLLFFGIEIFNDFNVSIQTAYGEQKNIQLPDGSEVILGSHTSLSYNKKTWQKKRELNLQGQAYFKVTKGQKFLVKTKLGNVQVLGTRFEVVSRKDIFNVICFEGKVAVSSLQNEMVLLPGKAVLIIGNKVQEQTVDNDKPDWFRGESNFENVPLKVVLVELENQYNIRFDTTKIVVNQNFTGSFPHNNLSLALASVFKPLNITYQVKDNVVKLFNRK